jgi:hypothetical protein
MLREHGGRPCTALVAELLRPVVSATLLIACFVKMGALFVVQVNDTFTHHSSHLIGMICAVGFNGGHVLRTNHPHRGSNPDSGCL